MIIIQITVAEIKELYFYDASVVDDLPLTHGTGLIAAFDNQPDDLDGLFLGWQPLSLTPAYARRLWYSSQRLAVVVQSFSEIYLFTFEDLTSLEAGLIEIRRYFSRY